jgi:hypothetical protein
MSRTNLRRVFTLTGQAEGPTGRELNQIAEEIVELARENADKILHKLTKTHPEILDQIQFVRRGNELRIGVRSDGMGQTAFYLASKEAREHVWLEPAVEAVMRRHRGLTAVRGIPRR